MLNKAMKKISYVNPLLPYNYFFDK